MHAPNILTGWKSRVADLPAETRVAWFWDTVTGLLSGVYQGCIWTFVLRVARADLHASAYQIGIITAAPAAGYLFATIWARQMDGRAKMPFVYWTWIVARGMFLLAPGIGSVFLARMCPGLSASSQFVLLVSLSPFVFSVSTPAYTAIMKDIYPDDKRGRLMSAVRVVSSLAALLTALSIGRMMDAGLNYRVPFAIGGAFGALTAWTFNKIATTPPADNDTDRMSTIGFLIDTFGILWRNPGYRWYTASVFVYGFGNLIASTVYPIYQVDRFHITNTQVANMQNIAAVITMFSYVFWGWFLDAKGSLVTVLLGIAMVCVMPLLYAGAWSIALLYVASAIGGFAYSGIDIGYLNTTLLFAEPGREAQYQALHSSFFGVRGTIAPILAVPLMHSVGVRPTFYICALIILGGAGLQIASIAHYRRYGVGIRTVASS